MSINSRLKRCQRGLIVHVTILLDFVQYFQHRYGQVCKLKFKLRDFTSSLCSAAAWAVCFEGSVAGVNATETGDDVSQPP